ncbi:S8 family serine peptidase [Aureispira sp. CCB-E]|uniref:S8 family serine peptidase n=1 Tax=Aureispira sp. CCB-E TaxID=3051121 RepID=UPI0028685FAA|nr:S8 family serine peptidase [Aureispira sp. CCB-E]WMX13510.1 S8 family serine peptidase [Aureispira sp. CCB-E]
MKGITLVKLFTILAVLPLLLFSCNKDAPQQVQNVAAEEVVTPVSNEGKIIPNQYIVILKDAAVAPAISYANGPFTDRAAKSQFMKEKSTIVIDQLNRFLIDEEIDPTKVLAYYTAVMSGFAIQLTEAEYEKLSKNNKVASLEHDREESLPDFKIESIDNSGARAQTTPCGITRAGGAANAGTARWIWIVDTGIDLDHPDLNVQTSYSATFAGGTANDCNGHGTHVAGTAAARNNSIGVVGVAANAPVVAVKVFSCSGSGSTSGILSGLNHVASNDLAGDVVNMSLGGYYGNGCSTGSSYRTILNSLSNAGTRVASAAGNSSAHAKYYQPACVNAPNVLTVASMTCSRNWSSFSNYGRGPCDFIATGSSVYSTYLNGGYATLSGTSMATPHVAGIMQVRNALPRSSGSVSNRGASYPIAVR